LEYSSQRSTSFFYQFISATEGVVTCTNVEYSYLKFWSEKYEQHCQLFSPNTARSIESCSDGYGLPKTQLSFCSAAPLWKWLALYLRKVFLFYAIHGSFVAIPNPLCHLRMTSKYSLMSKTGLFELLGQKDLGTWISCNVIHAHHNFSSLE
jgi:hypothetical protein